MITLALSKGRIFDETLPLLKAAGIEVLEDPEKSRKLILATSKPDVRVVIVSGYSEGDILGRLGGGRALTFLAKPFTRATLERKLRELLT